MKGTRQSKPGTMSAIKDAHIVKIAVEMDEQVPQLIEFDQQRPLTAIIQDLCNTWALPEPEQYSLQFSDNARSYITEKNRNDIKNGFVLRLTLSPGKTAQDILDRLHSNKPDDMRVALERLQRLSSDYTFALEFINKQGHQLLINMVEAGTYSGDHLALTLQSFVELMDHGIVLWDILEPKFIGRVANQVGLFLLPRVSLSRSAVIAQFERACRLCVVPHFLMKIYGAFHIFANPRSQNSVCSFGSITKSEAAGSVSNL